MGKVIFLVVAVALAFSFYKGWVGEWFETALTTSSKEMRQARSSNPRSDKHADHAAAKKE